jgi:signal transduction histidine kinase/CheY-like chemotaxis protein
MPTFFSGIRWVSRPFRGLCFLLLLLPGVALRAQSPLVLHDGQVRYRAEPAAWLLEDPRAVFTIRGVSAPALAARFRPGPAEGFNFGFTSKSYWVRLRVQSRASSTTWLLKVQNSALGQAVLYAPAGKDTTRFVAQPASLAYPFAQRLVKHRVPVFELPLAPGEARTFYLYFAGGGPVHFPLEIISARQFAEEDHLEGLLQGVYFGLMFVMIFYNLFLYLSIKDPSYLYYLFYVASFGILQASMNGIAYQYVWPTPSWWADHCVPVFIATTIGFGSLFCMSFLDLKRNTLFYYRVFGVLIGLSGLVAVLTVVASPYVSMVSATLLGMTFAGLVMAAAVVCLVRRFRPALFLLVAWSALLLGIVLFALNNLGVLPGTFLTTYGVQIGSALDVVLLSLALADRINLLQRERLRVEGEKVQAEQSKKVKEAFLAAVSHEIRTPMNAITGFARLLETAGLLPQHHEYARHIRVSADNLLAIINDVLDLSKLDAGKLHFERAEIDLDDLVRLLFQTISFGVNGEVNLSVRLLREDAQGVTLQFRVSDTGIGIPADKLATIFESYSQASKQTTRLYGGTGLGLTITKQLVELQGGTIGVESRVGAGTVFTVTLPLARNLGPARPKGNETAHSGALPGSLRSVLLVDDNALNLIVARHTLQYWRPGLSVHAVGSGAECLESLREGAYDLVLLDLQMPDMDGFETARRIRTQLPAPLNAVPVVALSAGDTAQDRLRARQVGMNDYLVKPFGAADLERITAQFVPADPFGAQIKENKFDLSLVEMASLGDPGFLVQLLNLFLDTTPVAVAQMQSAARGGDWATVAALAHKHRSFFTTLGLLELKEQLAALEESARRETGTNSENINILLFRFARACESAYAQVKQERDKLDIVDTKKE